MVGETPRRSVQAPQRGRDRDDRPRGRARSARSRPTTASDVLEEFHTMWRAAEYVTRGGVEYAQKLLIKTLGADMARRILDRVVKSFESTVGFTASSGRPAAALEVHPRRAPADDRADPGAPQAGQAAQLVTLAARRAARRGADADGQPRRNLARRHHPHLVGHRAAAEGARRPRRASSTAASAPWPSCSTASIAASASRCSKRSRASRRTWRCRSAT